MYCQSYLFKSSMGRPWYNPVKEISMVYVQHEVNSINHFLNLLYKYKRLNSAFDAGSCLSLSTTTLPQGCELYQLAGQSVNIKTLKPLRYFSPNVISNTALWQSIRILTEKQENNSTQYFASHFHSHLWAFDTLIDRPITVSLTCQHNTLSATGSHLQNTSQT